MTSIQRLPQPGDVIAGKYRIDHELGTGGMGAVYHVTHRVTGKRFALKWLLPQASGHSDAAQRFIREAQVAGRFEHPNIVEVYDVGAEADSFYMVMELLEGESLASRVERAGPLSVADACRLLIPCMHGVAEAHAAGIVHRDLKPANLFICSATRQRPEFAKVLDFGIARVSGTDEDVTGMTKSGTLIGTPHYMPLEQIRGRAVDHRADIYSFGVVLYQVLSGRLPFPADSFSDLVLMVAHESPTPLEDIVPRLPRGLAQIVARAMARDAADRYPHLGPMIEELLQFAAGGPAAQRLSLRPPTASLSMPTPLSTESQERLRLRTATPSSAGAWIAGLAAAVVLALGAGALWMKRNDLQALEGLRARATDPTSSPTAPDPANSAAKPTQPPAMTAQPPAEPIAENAPAPSPHIERLAHPTAAPASADHPAQKLEPLPSQLTAAPASDRHAEQNLEPPASQLTAADASSAAAPASAAHAVPNSEPSSSQPTAAEPRAPVASRRDPRAAPDRQPESLPPVPRPTARFKPPPVVRIEPDPPAQPPPEPDEARVKPRQGRVPPITEEDFY